MLRVIVTTTFWCDGENCEVVWHDQVPISIKTATALAETEGWQIDEFTDKHFCPECGKKMLDKPQII